MRKQKSTVTLLALALVLAFGAVPVMAAEDTVPPTIPTVYPIEVHSSESGGVYRLEKVYCLGTKDDPAAIPTQSFEREGRHYELLDLLKADQTETDTQEHIEIITLESSTKDMSEIIKVIEPVMEVTTEDGYTGTLTADYTTIQVEASGYKPHGDGRAHLSQPLRRRCVVNSENGGGKWPHPDTCQCELAGGCDRSDGRIRSTLALYGGCKLYRNGEL